MKSDNKAILSYFPLFDDVVRLDLATIKNFKINNVICLNMLIPFELNPNNSFYINNLCRKRNESIFSKKNNLLFLDFENNIGNINDYETYKNVYYNYFLSVFREEKFLNSLYIKRKITLLAKSCLIVEKKFINFLKNNNFTKIYLFNTRFPTGAAIANACKKMNIDMINYDLLANARIHYSVNKPFFHPKGFKEAIDSELKDINPNKLLKFGKKFIYHREHKKFIAYKIFNKNQTKGKLPLGTKEKFIAIFTHSVDEGKFYSESYGVEPVDQTKEIDKIIEICQKLNLQVIVRIHPNYGNTYQEKYLVNRYKNTNNIIVKGASKYDTYALIKSSLANISFGSSTGLESLLLDKNSYLIGSSIYQEAVKIKKFNNSRKCIQQIMEDYNNKLIFENSLKVESCMWFAYLSGEYAKSHLKNTNINLKKENTIYSIFFTIWRLERIFSYPINFNLKRIYKIILKEIISIMKNFKFNFMHFKI